MGIKTLSMLKPTFLFLKEPLDKFLSNRQLRFLNRKRLKLECANTTIRLRETAPQMTIITQVRLPRRLARRNHRVGGEDVVSGL
jgi:hypothetical protein